MYDAKFIEDVLELGDISCHVADLFSYEKQNRMTYISVDDKPPKFKQL
jgi:hypothetical protein